MTAALPHRHRTTGQAEIIEWIAYGGLKEMVGMSKRVPCPDSGVSVVRVSKSHALLCNHHIIEVIRR